MRKKTFILFFSFVFILLCFRTSYPKSQVKDLPSYYKNWLQKDVFYIITPKEKEVFLALETNRERDLFIKAFWEHRDPTPGTEKNEFKEEHYRRIDYANRMFRGSGKPGWKTDRGKVYIVLGKPTSQRTFRGSDSYYPCILWYYQGLDSPLLPQAFHLLFFQKGRIGEYILYHPAMHGPWGLMTSYRGNPGDYYESFRVLKQIEPQLAQVSISLIPNESITRLPSIASSDLLNRIDTHAIEKVKDKYAQKFLEYKNIVETEYSINYVESDYLTQIFRDELGISYVHYTIQLNNISMGQYSQNIYTDLDFNGRITDKQGNTVFQFEKKIPLSFTEEQFKTIKSKPFNFYDFLPLVPGEYEFSLIVKNSVSKEFTTFEKKINIPEIKDDNSIYMTPLLLGFNALNRSSSNRKPFKIENTQFYSQPGHIFINEDKLYVFFQLLELPEEIIETGSLEYVIFQEDQENLSNVFSINKYSDKTNFMEAFSLSEFYPGYYKIKVSLLDKKGRPLASQQENFTISRMDYISRPWVISKSIIDSGEPQIYYVLGKQYTNKKDYKNALLWLEKAYQMDPDNHDFAFLLAQSHFHLNNFEKCINLLLPFSDKSEDYSFYYLLGRTYQALSQYDKAIHTFENAIDNFGLNINLLNSIGECYYQTGSRKQALSFFNRSLQINPEQEKIQELVRQIKK